MKKWIFILSIGIFALMLSSCHKKTGQCAETPIPQNNAYINENYRYSIEIPEIIDQNCDVHSSSDRSEIHFCLKDSNDIVMTILTIPDQEYREERGRIVLGKRDGYTICLALPTCGTLEKEDSRKLWISLVNAAGKITPQAVHFIT